MVIKRFKIEKLIRDHIPEYLRSKNIILCEKEISDAEYVEKLKLKLSEEVKEIQTAENLEDLVEEFADILEVLTAISEAMGINMEHVYQKQIEKRKIKGGFTRKKFSEYADVDEENEAIKYFLNKKEQYPEIIR